MSTIGISPATLGDLESICLIDQAATGDTSPKDSLAAEIREGKCLIARVDGIAAGFAVIERSFLAQNIVSLLVVHPDYRNRGIGQAIIQYAEALPASFFELNKTIQSELASRRTIDKPDK